MVRLFIVIAIVFFFADLSNAQTFSFECFCGDVSGTSCDVCNQTILGRSFNGLLIRRNGTPYKWIDKPYTVREMTGNIVQFLEQGWNPENIKISLYDTPFFSMAGFIDSTNCFCNEGGAGGYYQVFRDNGTDMPQRENVNFLNTLDISFGLIDDSGSELETEIYADININAVDLNEIVQISPNSILGNPSGALANVQPVGLGAGLFFSGGNLVATDASTTNEVLTISDGTNSEALGGQTLTVLGAGINSSTYAPATNTLTIIGTEVDGSISNELQTYGHAGTTTYTNTLSGGGGSWSITGAGIASISQTGGAITVTATEVDGSVSNEGQLSVGAGTGTTSLIQSNTSGSPAITLQAGANITVSESGNTITITGSAGAADGNGIYGIDNSLDGNGHNTTVPENTYLNIKAAVSGAGEFNKMLRLETGYNSDDGGNVAITIKSNTDSVVFRSFDAGFRIEQNATGAAGDFFLSSNNSLYLDGDDGVYVTPGSRTHFFRTTGEIEFSPLTADPGSPVNGGIYWRSDVDRFSYHDGTAFRQIAHLGDIPAGGAPTTATYVTLSTDVTLANERVLTKGSNTEIVDNGAGGTIVVNALYGTHAASQITSNQNNYSPTNWGSKTVFTLSSDVNRNITGVSSTGFVDGTQRVLKNNGSKIIWLSPENSASSASNRFSEPAFVLPGNITNIVYDAAISRFQVERDGNAHGAIAFYDNSVGSTTAADYGNIAFVVAGTASANAIQTGSAGIPTMLNSSTGSTATGYAGVYHAKNAVSFGRFTENGFYSSATVLIPTLSNGTDRFIVYHSVTGTPTGTTTIANNSVGIRYTDNENSGNFTGFSKNNSGTESTVNLNIAAVVNTIYRLETYVAPDGSEACFFINGTYLGKVNSNMPTGTNAGVRTGILKTVGTGTANLRIGRIVSAAY